MVAAHNDHVIGIALVGLGGWGQVIAHAFTGVTGMRIVACYDLDTESVHAFAQTHGCHAAASYEELLRMPEVEGVVIITANHSHRELCVAAAEAGKHILVDKPIANTLADAGIMYQSCKKNNVMLSVGHNTRRQWQVRKIKSMVNSGVLGAITMVEGNFSHAGGLDLSPKQWRWYNETCPSGPLIQLGVHTIDTMQYLFGDVILVTSLMRKFVVDAEIDDTTMSILEFASGVLAYCGSGYTIRPGLKTFNVFGTTGTVRWLDDLQLLAAPPGVPVKKTTYPLPEDMREDHSLVEEVQEFVDAIAGKGSIETDAEAAIKALAVVEAAIVSNKTGATVKVQDLLDTYIGSF